MLYNIFKSIFLVSFIGTALTILVILSKPLTKKLFSTNWHYYIWLVVMAVMAFPVRFDTAFIEKGINTSQQFESIISVGRTIFMPAGEKTVFSVGIAEIWLVVAVVVLLVKVLTYLFFLHRLYKTGRETDCPELSRFTDKKIKVIISDVVSSPLMVGLLKSMVVLPAVKMTDEQLYYVFSHEMVHFKRRDILYKWFVCVVKSIHWFNPAVYLASKQIDIECEISCDAAATSEMSNSEKKGYIEAILMLISTPSQSYSLTTGMAVGEGFLKKRILSMKNLKKDGKAVKFISAAMVVICFAVTITISGVLSGCLLNKVEKQMVLTGEFPRIEFPRDSKNKKQLKEEATDTTREDTVIYQEDVVISEEIILPEEKVMPENAKVIKYNSDDKTTHYVTLYPDENGVISVCFDSENQSVPVSVSIYDSERPGQGWGYHLAAMGQEAYEFDGFIPEKTYTVEINTYCPGNYGIEGKAYVY